MVLIFAMLTLNGCGKDKGSERVIPPRYYNHYLWLSFQDTLGNDLVKGIEFVWSDSVMSDIIKPELYTLDIVFEDGITNPLRHSPLCLANGRLLLPSIANLDSQYLWLGIASFRKFDFAEKITLRLTCPYLFDDNEAYDIVTWWELHDYYTTCFRVEVDGREFPVKEDIATIILDR